MKFSSLYKQAIRTVQFSIAALICSVALNFGTAAPSLAAQVQVAPTPHLAIFGWGEKAESKAEQLLGKVQSKTGNKLEGTANQIKGRAKYDVGRVEDAAQRTGNKADKMAKDLKKGTDKNLSKAGDSIKDTANNLVDGAKKIINN
jgi:cytochrome c556